MKSILEKLCAGFRLSEEESKNILINITKGIYNEIEIASFLTIFLMRKITASELSGFRKALLELAIKIDLSEFETIDLCGTGGDGKNTFNISTITAFVVAGAGYKVAKHGNYSVSSASGSSNVLEYLGYNFTNNSDILKNQLKKYNLCFLHAPLFHPAMKSVALIRKKLGMKTFFNILGPLVNPSYPQYQFVGVSDMQTARNYDDLLQETAINYTIVHALDGYDEISLTGKFQIFSKKGTFIYKPENLGFEKIAPQAIFGGNNVPEAAKIFKNILAKKGTNAQNKVLLTNAAFAIMTIDSEMNFESAYDLAKNALLSGKAEKCLKNLTN